MDRFFKLKFLKNRGDDKEYSDYSLEEEIDKNLSTSEQFKQFLNPVTDIGQLQINNIFFTGAIALLKSEKYPSYSQICTSHRETDEDGTIIVKFIPCKDKDNNFLFVKHYNGIFTDCIFCSYGRKMITPISYPEKYFSYITFFNKAGI